MSFPAAPLQTVLFQSPSPGDGGTSTAADFTNCDLLILVSIQNQNTALQQPVDSSLNTWNQLNTYTSVVFGSVVTTFYAWNAIVTNAQTFTIFRSSSALFNCFYVEGWSGSRRTSDPFDVQTGTQLPNDQTNTRQLPTLTPSLPNSLMITGLTTFARPPAETVSIDSSFNISNQSAFLSSTHFGGACASKITSSAESPTWSWLNIDYNTVAGAVFAPGPRPFAQIIKV
jgi:hypothetical protein